MVQICLGGLAPRFGAMRTAVLTRENPPYFDLQFMLLVEENHVRTMSNSLEGHMLYTHSNQGRGRSRARRDQFGQAGWGSTYENKTYYRQDSGYSRGMFERKGSCHVGPSQQNDPIKCGYCGKVGHHEEECWKKKNESTSTSWQLINHATYSEYDKYGGLFVMRYKET